MRDLDGRPVMFPKTAEEWAEPRWVDYACHADAPWLDDRLRQRIHDFVTVLRCRYPTVQDLRSPAWAKHGLRAMAGWRYQHGKYARPWERSEEHTSELQSLMRISYAVFCSKNTPQT